jgi:hypothetical protein
VIRFLWNATRGYRLRPWASPYLRWRMETYAGLHADHLTAQEAAAFAWRHRAELWRFLQWAGRMDRRTTTRTAS